MYLSQSYVMNNLPYFCCVDGLYSWVRTVSRTVWSELSMVWFVSYPSTQHQWWYKSNLTCSPSLYYMAAIFTRNVFRWNRASFSQTSSIITTTSMRHLYYHPLSSRIASSNCIQPSSRSILAAKVTPRMWFILPGSLDLHNWTKIEITLSFFTHIQLLVFSCCTSSELYLDIEYWSEEELYVESVLMLQHGTSLILLDWQASFVQTNSTDKLLIMSTLEHKCETALHHDVLTNSIK